MGRYISPTGAEIIGTSDTIPCVALIDGINEDGTPEYCGESDLDWDGQTTTQRNGKILFVDDNGDEWTFDQLTPADDEEG